MDSIFIREVWEGNLDEEFKVIKKCLSQFPFAAFDTEFPGTVYNPAHIPKHLFSSLPPSQLYSIMKQNVNTTKIIQLGLTLFDADGNLPNLGTKFKQVWQFNFRDFDCDRDRHNPESIALLERQGIDFSANKKNGIDSKCFSMYSKYYGLARAGNLKWITFQGLYDYGYLIKILTGRELPENYCQFCMLVQQHFGNEIYDVKLMAQALGMHGGLEKIAQRLHVDRAAGKSHQAGSDSLLTMQVFLKLVKPVMQVCRKKTYVVRVGPVILVSR